MKNRKTTHVKGQITWESIYDDKGNLKEVITSDLRREKYYLYTVKTDGTLVKIATGKSPLHFNKSKAEE